MGRVKAQQIEEEVATARQWLEATHPAPRVAEFLQNKYGMSQRTAYRRINDALTGAEIVANPSKEKGTKSESAVVRAARAAGFPDAERLALAGAHDLGDVRLCRGVVVEVKGGKAAEEASLNLIDDWLGEADKERVNSNSDFALLVTKRRGKGYDNAHTWDGWMHFADFARLAAKAYDRPLPPDRTKSNAWISAALTAAPVRMTVCDFFDLFRHAGYPERKTPVSLGLLR